MLRTSLGLNVLQDVAEPNASEKSCRHPSRTPAEPKRLLDDVLLLSSVSCTDEGDRDGDDFELGPEVFEGQARVLAEARKTDIRTPGGSLTSGRKGLPSELHFPVLGHVQVDLRYGPMVADEEEVGGGEEALVEQVVQLSFGVEGMLAGEANHARVTRNPSIWASAVELLALDLRPR